jgi:DNA-directed RNA polymerase subunit RPC12/RpoP
MGSQQVRIMIRCPQCGGDIDFLEEDNVICCEFCGSSLLVAGRQGVLRYVLPPRIENPREARSRVLEHLKKAGHYKPKAIKGFLFYAPFWRIQGMVFRWVFGYKQVEKPTLCQTASSSSGKVKVLLTRVFDHTVRGFMGVDLGIQTLGVRSQVLRLQVFNRTHLGKRSSFLPLDVPLKDVREEAKKKSKAFLEAEDVLPEVILHRLIGGRLSVIYFPIWYVECRHQRGRESLLLDAVGGGVIRSLDDMTPIHKKLLGNTSRKSFKFKEILFLPFRCPNCGWDLPYRPLSVMHFCPTCLRLGTERGGRWKEVAYGAIHPPEGNTWDGLIWIPFWRYQVVLKTARGRLKTMADLYRVAPPPRVVDWDREAERPISFYLPAARFRDPKAVNKLGSRLTFLQHPVTPKAFPKGSQPATVGVSLPKTDAQRMWPVLLGALIPPRSRQARGLLNGSSIAILEPRILYFPFVRVEIFWKELWSGLSFQGNALSEDLPKTPRQ